MSTASAFRTLLVANRGEIAVRILRTARRLGYRTVAVFSDADRNSRHVAGADRAVAIGPALPAASYLDANRLIEAARCSGADAVHPGYGFLSEQPGFARACREAGLVFVGPPPEAIAAMGDKAMAKRLMQAAGVPCIPGYDGETQDDDRLLAEAQRLGAPLMIKAVAGGGGRGMRRVAAIAGFPAALRAARSEAGHAFGDDRVLLERALDAVRHIEIQVFADRHGHVVHLGERDCSVQRRHQKIVEEAPSPAVDAALRERMGATAVAAARAIGYEGAGTVEFLLDGDGRFYFMEMNTRLQVEHPVTEALTGLDLVEWQLRVAAGEPLPLAQNEIRCDGHAIEARLCAESPRRDFLPQSGTIVLWRPADGVRIDTALETGGEVPPHYDSLLAKLVVHGRDREEARRRLLHALEDSVLLGLETNRGYLARCLQHPAFAAGAATTAFIEQHGAELLAADPDLDSRAHALAAVLLYATAGGDDERPSPLSHALPVSFHFSGDAGPSQAVLQRRGLHRYAVSHEGREHEIGLHGLDANEAVVECDGIVERVVLARRGVELWLHFRGAAFRIEDRTHAPATRNDMAGGDGRVRAAMTGRIVAVHVAVGDVVAAGQPVFSLEAMKMEHVHAATATGRVTALHAALGEQVAAFRVLAEIDPVPAAGDA